jgi:folate-binding protein YgfZ
MPLKRTMADSTLASVRPTQTAAEQLAALRTGAGMAPLSDGWIAVTGEDRVRWLNGMVTNSVQALTPGEGSYSFLLSAQGRIQGDATVWATPDLLLMQTDRSQVEPLMALLDRFIIMDDVELSDESEQWQGLLVAGPLAAEKLTGAGVPVRPSRLLKKLTVPFNGTDLQVLCAYSPVVPRFEIWSRDSATLDKLRSALADAGVTECSAEGLELLRIAEGTPRFGTDIRDRDLPQETAQTRALHFNKGCYLGQEIVERIRSRGNVHRTFTTFVLTGEVPAPGTALTAEGKPVGELTSIASEPIDGERLALGFVRREAIDRALPLIYEGGTAAPHSVAAAS